MRYKQEIWSYYIKFIDEERLMNFKKEKGRENVKAFYDMEDETFFRLLNTYAWLTKFNSNHLNMTMTTPIKKPTNQEILEALDLIHVQGEDLMLYAELHPKGTLRTDLRKMAKKQVKCAAYYTQLVNDDFYNDKYIGKNDCCF